MAEILTSAQMRAVEAAAIDSFQVSALALMERAGQGAVQAVLDHWPDLGTPQVLVLAGPGNNGGDGFVMARGFLARGATVHVVHLAGPNPSPELQAMRAAWLALGPIWPWTGPGFDAVARQLAPDRPLLVIDALFGIGLSRPLAPDVLAPWADMRRAWQGPCRMVAVDIPSGVSERDQDGARLAGFDGMSGPVLTVTFHALKQAQARMLSRGERITLVDIGLGAGGLPPDLVAALRKSPQAHKYTHGHALILSGGVGRGGAARLAARAALRVGAGLVTLACPPAALQENACQLDAILLRPVRDAAALAALLDDPRLNALCLGPGLGLGAREEGLVAACLATGRALVLDADALTLLARSDRLRAALHPACVLTPHAGEFARLCPDLAGDGVARAAQRLGCLVLLKGPVTTIATPDGDLRHARAEGAQAAPWLATAGAGDVLAGIITGLLARGLPPLMAAQGGAVLHQAAARAFGPGLTAEDLPGLLPVVLRAASV